MPGCCASEALDRQPLVVPQGFWLSSISESLQLIVVYHRNQPQIFQQCRNEAWQAWPHVSLKLSEFPLCMPVLSRIHSG